MSRDNECPICGGNKLQYTGDVVVPFRTGNVLVPQVDQLKCDTCGEVYMNASSAHEMNLRAVEIARKDKGLLTPDEIRDLRTRMGLTQSQLEDIVGVGPKSVTRWEKGTVFQSRSADKIMRALLRYPILIKVFGNEYHPSAMYFTSSGQFRTAGGWQTPRRAASGSVTIATDTFGGDRDHGRNVASAA